MLALLLTVIPLGIGAAFTPSLFAIQLLIVGGDPWRVRALAAFAGGAIAFGVALTLLLLGFARLPTPSSGTDHLAALLRIGAAVLLAVITAWFLLPHGDLEARVRDDIQRRVQSASARDFFGLTFLLSIKDVSSFILLVPAMHDIGVATVPWLTKVGTTVLVLALALSGLIIPVLLRTALGSRGRHLLRRIYEGTMRNQFRIMAVVFGVLSVYLLVSGIREL